MKNNFKFVYVFLFIFSAIFMGVGWYLTRTTQVLISEGEKTVGTVVGHISSYDSDDGSTTYSPKMQYNCNGLEQLNYSNMYSSSKYDIWEKRDIYCDPAKPNKFIIDSFTNKYFGLFFVIPGFITFLIALGIMLYNIRRAKLIEYLKSNGSTITAEVTFVWKNHSYSVNGKNPFYIKAIFEDGSITRKFTSDNFWEDIGGKVGVWDSIKVYVYSDLNGVDYKKNWIDIRFITETEGL